MSWSVQQRIEFQAPEYLCNIVRIITETGLRVYKELLPMKKEQVDLEMRGLDARFENAERDRRGAADRSGCRGVSRADPNLGTWDLVVPERRKSDRSSESLKMVWHLTLRRAKVPYFLISDLRSTYATRLSAGGVADEWVTQPLQHGDAKLLKKYLQIKLQMKREALRKLSRKAIEGQPGLDTRGSTDGILSRFCHGRRSLGSIWVGRTVSEIQEVI